MEANQISKQNRYPCHNTRMVLGINNDYSIEVKSEWQKEGTAVPHGRRQFSILVKGFDFCTKGGNFLGCLW